MSSLWNGDQHQETTCFHLCRCFHPLFSLHILRWYSVFPPAPFLINPTAAVKETLVKVFFLFPRGCEASSEGSHCSTVFNVNQKAQTWVTLSLSCLLFASTKARSENRDALQNYKLYSQHLQEECDQPTFERKLAYLMKFQLLNLCDSNITSVFFYFFFFVKCIMKVYFWLRRVWTREW